MANETKVDEPLKLGQGAMLVAKLGGDEFKCLCGKEAVTECESCSTNLCDDCADFTTYDDVDVCKDTEACGSRCEG